ncbi:hypothetical protein CCP3SC1_2600001 [Gammaproteobacteria bacterium]
MVPSNDIGAGPESDIVEVVSLTSEQLYLLGISEKINNNQPIRLDEATSHVTGSQQLGSAAAALIASNSGTIARFIALGIPKGVSEFLAILALVRSDEDAMTDSQFDNAKSMLASQFMDAFFPGASNSRIPLAMADMLVAFDKPGEKRRLVDWLTSQMNQSPPMS